MNQQLGVGGQRAADVLFTTIATALPVPLAAPLQPAAKNAQDSTHFHAPEGCNLMPRTHCDTGLSPILDKGLHRARKAR
jgi:hypothetical protein